MPETSDIAKIVLLQALLVFTSPILTPTFLISKVLYIFETQRLSIINSQHSFPQVFQVLMVTVLLFICIIVTLFVFHYHLPSLFRGGLSVISFCQSKFVVWVAS